MMVVVVFADGFHQSLRREIKRKSTDKIGIYQSDEGFKKPILEQNVSKVLFKYMSTLRTKRPALSWLNSSVGRALHRYHRGHAFFFFFFGGGGGGGMRDRVSFLSAKMTLITAIVICLFNLFNPFLV